jgi:hypothetical protein
MSSTSHVSQFLKPADDLNTANSTVGFFPSVQITSQFTSVTRLRTTSLHGKSIAITIFLSKLLKIWPEKCGWEWWGYIQYMPYLASWRHRRYSTINAVPRQSFVIHPNGGWRQSRAQEAASTSQPSLVLTYVRSPSSVRTTYFSNEMFDKSRNISMSGWAIDQESLYKRGIYMYLSPWTHD